MPLKYDNRDVFLAALDAYRNWNPGEPEPVVEFGIDRPIPISQACDLVLGWPDTLPSVACLMLEEVGIGDSMEDWTFGSAARAMRTCIAARLVYIAG